ncbi:uncharacterized protein LOC122041448 [Zingiber officinale]|uniref:uncharacterized protein LOC122041448 n=1 Tax=Zingiber officinale TaxID=94328 RepID=UPI001C4BC42D|nr:uncharacterized protein LOC122041448 [Zingiber officinale]
MATLGHGLLLLWLLCLWVLTMAGLSSSQQPSVISSFRRPRIWLGPYDWTYLRVELPPWFSSVAINFVSDVDIDKAQAKHLPKSNLPLVCFRGGSPPIPDVSDMYLDNSLSMATSNESFGGSWLVSDADQCIPFQRNLSVTLTNDQISPGIWYFGFFNGLGPARTQSKMINRGKAYLFSISIIVEGCSTMGILGPYCNQSVNMISCTQSSINKYSRNLLDSKNITAQAGENKETNNSSSSETMTFEYKNIDTNASVFITANDFMTCNNSIESSCLANGDWSIYSMDLVSVTSQFVISLTDLSFNQTPSMGNSSGIMPMCYVRYNAMPLKSLHDYSSDLSVAPLIVKSPKIGRWFIAFQAVNQTESNGVMHETFFGGTLCFSFLLQVPECKSGKAGLNCSWEAHTLQRALKNSAVPFTSYYHPDGELGSTDTDFSIGQLLSNSSVEQSAWTYFLLDIPTGAAGANIHVRLSSDSRLNYGVYTQFGSLPSIHIWDYYADSTSSTNGSMFLTSNDSSGKTIEFYVLSASEGTWCIGIMHPPRNDNSDRTTMSIWLEGCPSHCNHHGACRNSIDETGLTFYSYCECDRDHGGFDCSHELVSHQGHIWQTIFLVASNGAAILPAYWALRQKAFAEWVIYTASGISSGLYHACDRGTWCVLSFHALQFLDFWLSFMAVVSTFVYMTTIDDSSKRAIHTSVSIFTALLAETGATRSENIAIVLAIGAAGLLLGWFLEFSTVRRAIHCPPRFDLNMPERWQSIKSWFQNLIGTLRKRFYWRFLILGFVTLAMAATCWTLESNKDYWIWHSLWHITIYTSSFFFIYSTCTMESNEHQEAVYELTRQNSLPRAESEAQCD